MRRGYYTLLLIFIGFVLGGFAAEIIQHFYSISFEAKLSLGDVIVAATTLLVAVLVTNYLEKHNQTERIEKDLLLRKVEAISKLVEEFEKSKENGSLIEIQSSLKRVSVSCIAFNSFLSDIKYPKDCLDESNVVSLISEIRKLATDSPIREIEAHAKRSKCNSTVKDGIITLTKDRMALLEGRIDVLKARLLRIQININRK